MLLRIAKEFFCHSWETLFQECFFFHVRSEGSECLWGNQLPFFRRCLWKSFWVLAPRCTSGSLNSDSPLWSESRFQSRFFVYATDGWCSTGTIPSWLNPFPFLSIPPLCSQRLSIPSHYLSPLILHILSLVQSTSSIHSKSLPFTTSRTLA